MFKKKLIGYVVNILDPLNFQISFDTDIKDSSRETYSYSESGVLKEGTAYKCRLHGLTIDKKSPKYSDTITLLNDRINLQNGWVICNLLHVDKYKRIIIEMYDPVSFESFSSLLLLKDTCVNNY